MAILRAPLFSLQAHGQIASTIVYASWKGIPYARMYTIPTNPNTAAQQAQRTAMSHAVKSLQDMTGDDREGWNDAALVQAIAMSGSNLAVSNLVKGLNADTDSVYAQNLDVVAGGGQTIYVTGLAKVTRTRAQDDTLTDLEVRYGTSPQLLGNVADFPFDGNDYHAEISVASAGKWFVRIFSTGEDRYISGLHEVVVT